MEQFEDRVVPSTFLVQNIHTGTQDSLPSAPVFSGTTALFAATDGISGRELWRTDGTDAGTSLLKDLQAGATGASPVELTEVNGTWYFRNSTDNRLWRSDGTNTGTVPVSNAASGPTSLTNVNGTLFFSASGANGVELWKTDGTAAGTVQVRDINPTGSSSPTNLFNFNGTLIFSATEGPIFGTELWRSDGTPGGTVRVKDIYGTSGNSVPSGFTILGGILYFAAADAAGGRELWRTDGTDAGTFRVKDVNPGATGSDPTALTAVGGLVYFAADNGTHGQELWVTDGTDAGTRMVADLAYNYSGGVQQFVYSSRPQALAAAGGKLYFSAEEYQYRDAPFSFSGRGRELWVIDAPGADPRVVADLAPGLSGSDPRGLTALGGSVYFAADVPGVGLELWASDGTAAGTRLVKDIYGGTNGSNPAGLVVAGGVLYFTATDPFVGTELWKTDGTDAGTTPVADVFSGPAGSGASAPVVVGGNLFYFANDGVNGTGLYQTDGTAAGTTRVKTVGGTELTASGGAVYFRGNDGRLWRSDGTGLGTVQLTTTVFPSALTDVGGVLYFASSGAHGAELWKTDGTVFAVRVKDINPGDAASSPANMVRVGDLLYFTADDGLTGRELWTTDGTETGTVRVKDINTATAGSAPTAPVAVGGTIYYVANDGINGQELWKTDGTTAGTARLEITPGAQGTFLANLTAVGNTLYFTNQSDSGRLWKTDGTPAGTARVSTAVSFTSGLFAGPGGAVYFLGVGGDGSGAELWTSDGTAAGTTRVADINIGPAGSSPTPLFSGNGLLYFSADDGVGGRELWATDGEPGTRPLAYSQFVTVQEDGSQGITLLGRDAENDPLTYEIVTGPAHGTLTGSGANLTYTPAAEYAGPDSFTFRVFDGTEISNLATVSITVVSVNDAPRVEAGLNQTATEGTAVSFAGSATDVEGDALISYIWDFGDGTTASGPTATHVYRDNGIYTARLRVTDAKGAVGVGELTVTANNVAPTIVSVANSGPVSRGTPVSVTVVASDPGGANDPLLYEFDFDGDGVFEVSNSTGVAEHTYAVNGTYPVGVRVSDGDGGVALGSTPVRVAPAVTFASAGQTVGEEVGTVTVEALLTEALPDDLIIPLAVTDATAGAGDFALGQATLVIPAGQTTGFVTVSVSDDRLNESSESFALVMGDPVHARLGATTRHLVTIADNDPLPQVSFGTPITTTTEESGAVGITVRLSEPSGRDVTVPLAVSGTLGGSDYSLPVGLNVVIPAGAVSATFIVQLTDDGAAEPAESLVIRMLDPVHAAPDTLPGAATVHTLVVAASDTPTVTFTAAAQTVQESAGQFTVTARLSAPHYLDVTIPVTFSGTAQVGSDYTAPASIVIPAGQTTGALVVTLIDDTVIEGSETVTVAMGELSSALPGATRSFVATVPANDVPTVSFATASQSVWEGGTSQVTVTLSNAVSVPVRVTLRPLLPPPPPPGYPPATLPYTLSSTSVLIPANTLQGSVTLTATSDGVNKPLGAGTLLIDQVTEDNAPVSWPLGTRSHSATILDDDPYVYFTTAAQSANEVSRRATVTVELSSVTNKNVTVPFTLKGTATWGRDYSLAANSITIPAGQRSAAVTITITDDGTVEKDETIEFKIDTPTNALIQFSQQSESRIVGYAGGRPRRPIYQQVVTYRPVGTAHSITLVDNDLPTVSFNPTKVTAKEGVDTFGNLNRVAVTAELSAAVSRDVTVVIRATGGTAKSSDYTLGSTTITIPAGQMSGSATITLKNDSTTESTETLTIEMRSVTNATLGRNTKFTLTIKDDDTPPPSPKTPPAPRPNPPQIYPPGTLAIDTTGGGVYAPPPAGHQPVVGTTTPLPPAQAGVIALVFDGYIEEATVFLDANRNGALDYLDRNGNGLQDADEPFEPAWLTGPDGRYLMTVPAEFDRNLNGWVDPADGQLIAVGGVDTSTGLPLAVPMTAPGGSLVVTPLTTLVAALVDRHGLTADQAEARLREALGMSDVPLSRFDAVTEALAGNPDGLAVFTAGAMVQDTIAQAAALIAATAGGPPLATVAGAVAADVAGKIAEAGSGLDLTDPVVIEAILLGVVTDLGVAHDPAVLTGAAAVVAAGNQLIAAAVAEDALTFLTQIARVQQVAQGHVAARLAAVGSGQLGISAVVSGNTGQALIDRVAAAVVGDFLPPILSVSDARVVEGASEDESWFEFTVTPDRASSRSVSVEYSTADFEAELTDGDYLAAAGTLTWAPGDSSPKTVRVRVLADERFETDEAFLVMLSRPVNALLGKDIGNGVIVNDDALVYAAPADGGPNRLHLRLEGDDVELTRNDEVVFSGLLTNRLPLTIVGVDGVEDALTVELVGASSVLTGGLTFRGGAGAGDNLTVFDGATAAVTHAVGAGNLSLDGAVIVYEGVESVTDGLAPGIAGVPVGAVEGQPVGLTGVVADADAADAGLLSWQVTRGGVVYATGSGAAFDFTPSDNGTYLLSLTFTDANGAVGTTTREITVANAPPAATDDTVGADEDTPIAVDVRTNDADPAGADDPLTVTAITQGSHGSVAINPDGTLTYTPVAEFSGTDSFTYTVNDGDGGAATATVAVTVRPVNDTPTGVVLLGSLVAENSNVGTAVGALSASDPDAVDTYTFTLVAGDGADDNALFAIDGDVLRTAAPLDHEARSSHTVRVRATDAGGLWVERALAVTVANVNEAPVLAAVGNREVAEDGTLTFAASAADPDAGQSITYSLVGAPSGAFIDPATGAFTWTPAEDQGPGTFTFSVRVNDSGSPSLTDEESITVTVSEVNRTPVLAPIADRAINESEELRLAASADDPDRPIQSLTFSLIAGPAGMTIDPTTGVLTWVPADGPMTSTVTVRVTDGGTPALTADRTFAVDVRNVAPMASFAGPGEGTVGFSVTFRFEDPSDPSPTDAAAGFRYSYDFDGDGAYEVLDSLDPSQSFAYPASGTYTVRGRIADKDGGSREYTATVVIGGTSPEAPQVAAVLVGYGRQTAALTPGAILPWATVNRISVRFTADVRVDAGDLRLTGVKVAAYGFASFVYDPMTFTATWVLTRPLGIDRLVIRLDGDGPGPDDNDGVRDLHGVFLDGGDYQLGFASLPGDFNRNGVVDLGDLARVSLASLLWFGSSNAYNPYYDADGDGDVDLADVLRTAVSLGTRLPN